MYSNDNELVTAIDRLRTRHRPSAHSFARARRLFKTGPIRTYAQLLNDYDKFFADIKFVAICLFCDRRYRASIGLLFRELHSEDTLLSGAASAALARIGGKRVLSRLNREFSSCKDGPLRRVLLSALCGAAGSEVPSQIGMLIDLVETVAEDVELRAIAADGLVRLLHEVDRRTATYKWGVNTLVEMLADRSPLIRLCCIHALGELRIHSAFSKLTDLSQNDRARVEGVGTVADAAKAALVRLASKEGHI